VVHKGFQTDPLATLAVCQRANLLQNWPAWLQSHTLATTAIPSQTTVRLSTRHTIPVIICFSVLKTSSCFIFCITHLFYSCPVSVEFSWTWLSVCCFTHLQIPFEDCTILCHLYIARFTAKQHLRFACNFGRYINLSDCTLFCCIDPCSHCIALCFV